MSEPVLVRFNDDVWWVCTRDPDGVEYRHAGVGICHMARDSDYDVWSSDNELVGTYPSLREAFEGAQDFLRQEKPS